MEYTINTYRSRRFGDKHFVTTDSGSHVVLDDAEFRKLKSLDIDPELYSKLEEREIILTPQNYQEHIRNLNKRYNFLYKGTSMHIIVLTLRCNMNCIYCHASSAPEEGVGYDMDEETAKAVVDFAFQSPNQCLLLEFQGGEPLLNWPILKYIVDYAKEVNKKHKKDLIISVVTNLIEMDEEKMDYLIENDIGVCTSLDGPKDVHDKNRPWQKGSNYDIVVKWIRRFQEEYEKRDNHNRRINALVTLTKRSLDYPKEIIDEYINLGMNRIFLRYLNQLGVAKKTWEQINYTPEEFISFWEEAVDYIEEKRRQGTDMREFMVNVMLKKITTKYDPNHFELRSPCGAAIGQIVYNYDGSIYTCDEARMIGDDLFMLGNVRDSRYSDIVTCDKACAVVNASINDQYICDNCAYKPYCGVCPVCNFAEQGNIIGKISESDSCKIHMAQFDWIVKKFINIDTKE